MVSPLLESLAKLKGTCLLSLAVWFPSWIGFGIWLDLGGHLPKAQALGVGSIAALAPAIVCLGVHFNTGWRDALLAPGQTQRDDKSSFLVSGGILLLVPLALGGRALAGG